MWPFALKILETHSTKKQLNVTYILGQTAGYVTRWYSKKSQICVQDVPGSNLNVCTASSDRAYSVNPSEYLQIVIKIDYIALFHNRYDFPSHSKV